MNINEYKPDKRMLNIIEILKDISIFLLGTFSEVAKCPEFVISSCLRDCELQGKAMKKGSTDDHGCLECQCSQSNENISVAKNGKKIL